MLFEQTIPITVAAGEVTATKTFNCASGTILAAWLTIPAADNGATTGKVAIRNPTNNAIIYMPDSAISSGTAPDAATTAGYFALTGDGYPVNGTAQALLTLTILSAGAMACSLHLIIRS